MSPSELTPVTESYMQTKPLPGSFDDNEERDYTSYIAKSIQVNDVPKRDGFLAACCSWFRLGGLIEFPGTFTSVNISKMLAGNTGRNSEDAAKYVPILVLAGVCCGIGSLGTGWLWWIWQLNTGWLIRQIFLPGLLHSLVGLITPLVNVYTAQGGHWSNTAKTITIVICICTGNISLLYIFYKNWVLEKMRIALDRVVVKTGHP